MDFKLLDKVLFIDQSASVDGWVVRSGIVWGRVVGQQHLIALPYNIMNTDKLVKMSDPIFKYIILTYPEKDEQKRLTYLYQDIDNILVANMGEKDKLIEVFNQYKSKLNLDQEVLISQHECDALEWDWFIKEVEEKFPEIKKERDI